MRNSSWDQFHYWTTYGKNPLAKYYATEYKFLGDAEAALLVGMNIPKTFYERMIDVIDSIVEFFTKDRDKIAFEKYLSESVDHVDLEYRMRKWERGYKQNTPYI